MRRRELVRSLLALAAAPALLALGTRGTAAQGTPTPASPPEARPVAPDGDAATPSATTSDVEAADRGPIRNNIVGLNVARLHQPLYIWATSDLVNANGGDWGYITVVWTIEDREGRNNELNLQVFLDRCYEFHLHPIVRVATRFDPKKVAWAGPEWDEPPRWREYFERATWPTERVWIIAGNEPNLGREWGGEVDAPGYARYLNRFLDVFEGSTRFKVVNAPLDISNTTDLPKMQDALEFLDEMAEAVPGIFERLPAWASNPYRVISGGPGARYTHRAYEAELDRIGRELPVIITEAGHLETGDEEEIARFYDAAFKDWATDPKVIAATPLFWHPDRDDYWMFELDKKGAFVSKSPTYELLRKIPRVAGSPRFVTDLPNVARATPYEQATARAADVDDDDGRPAFDPAGAAGSPQRGARLPDPMPAPPDAEGEDDAVADVPAAQASPAGQAGAPGPSVQAGTPRPSGSPADARAAIGAQAEALRIANTDGLGARLRAEPSPEATAIAVLPDGARVEGLGPTRQTGAQAWRRVRTEDGALGWVAADLLAPATYDE